MTWANKRLLPLDTDDTDEQNDGTDEDSDDDDNNAGHRWKKNNSEITDVAYII